MHLLGLFKKATNKTFKQYASTEQRVHNMYVPKRELHS